MFQKVFQALISSDINTNLWFSVSFWSVTSGISRPERSLLIYCGPKIYFEWQLRLQTFGFFLDILKIYSQLWKLCLILPFFIEIWTERGLFQKSAFLHVTSGTVWNCFLTCNYLLQIITCIKRIKLLSLSFITYTFISWSLPFIYKINFLSFKCHVRNFWNGPEAFLFNLD